MTSGQAVLARPRLVPWGVSTISFIIWCTAGHVVLGLAAMAAWSATGHWEWMRLFFNYPGAVFLVEMAALEFRLSRAAWRTYTPGEPMATAWLFIVASASCHLLGAFCSQVLGADTVFNPLARAGADPSLLHSMRDFGTAVAGPMHMVLLVCGLFCVLRVYRRWGMLEPIGPWNWLLVGVVAVYSARESSRAIAAVRGGTVAPLAMIGWASLPLLTILIAQAACLYRSSKGMGGGLISRCWSACAVAVLLTCIGDAVMWASSGGYVSRVLQYVNWYVWLPVAAAYALGPAWQMEACRRAAGPGA